MKHNIKQIYIVEKIINKLKQAVTLFLDDYFRDSFDKYSTDFNLINNIGTNVGIITLNFKPTPGDKIQLETDQEIFFLVQEVRYSKTGYVGDLLGKIV